MTTVGTFVTTVYAAGEATRSTKVSPRYKLMAGMGYTVCERYVRMLNAFPPDEPPMICEQKLHADFQDFAYPWWDALDVKANMELLIKIERWLYGQGNIIVENKNPIWKSKKPTQAEWVAEIERRINTGESRPRLRRAQFALTDDKREWLLAYTRDTGQCERDLATYRASYSSWDYLFLYNADGQVELSEDGSFNADGTTNMNRRAGHFLPKLHLLGGHEQIVLHNGRSYVVTTFASLNPPAELKFHLRPAIPTINDPEVAYAFPDRCVVHFNFNPSKAK